MKKDYLYIIGNDKGYIKVGVSKNPERRVKQAMSISLLYYLQKNLIVKESIYYI